MQNVPTANKMLWLPCHSYHGSSASDPLYTQLGSYLPLHFSSLSPKVLYQLRHEYSRTSCPQRTGKLFRLPSSCAVWGPKLLLQQFRGCPIRILTLSAEAWRLTKEVHAGLGVSTLVQKSAHNEAKASRQSLEMQLNGLRIKAIGTEGQSGQLVLKKPSFNRFFGEIEDISGNLQKRFVDREHGELLEVEGEIKTWQLSSEKKDNGDAYGNPDSNDVIRLEEIMMYLENIGVDFTTVIQKESTIAKSRVDRVRRVVHFLQHLGFKKMEVRRMLVACPRLLLHSGTWMELKQIVNFLVDEVGVPRRHLKRVISSCPRLLVCSVKERMRPTLRYLRSLGFTNMGAVILIHASLLTFGIDEKLLPKIRFLQSVGLSHDEVACMLLRFPTIFNYSLEANLKRKYRYLVDEMGGDLQELKAFPQFFGFSLENRIRPRHRLLAQINIRLSLPTMLKMSDKEFYAKFRPC